MKARPRDDAIYKACLLRFRPILMTTMAAMLGALPLALGHGTGAELRRPLGITIIGGLIVSQLLTLYTTPVVYLSLDRLRLRWKGERAPCLIAWRYRLSCFLDHQFEGHSGGLPRDLDLISRHHALVG